ncbi:MAG: hypothetical protein GVY17_13615 [Cyanobacteria bacterium]|jgi:hypothetical protein|nr:hypothetical protein [Cyanobacteria bacterium GSL.Bin21]
MAVFTVIGSSDVNNPLLDNRGGSGEDTYTVGGAFTGGAAQFAVITDPTATIELVPGVEITVSEVQNDSLTLTFSNGSQLTILQTAQIAVGANSNAVPPLVDDDPQSFNEYSTNELGVDPTTLADGESATGGGSLGTTDDKKDVIGSEQNDALFAKGNNEAGNGELPSQGNDNIQALEGDDLLKGGDGNDTLNGGTGIDFLAGNDGEDVIDAGNDDDRLFLENTIDRLGGIFGGNEDDLLEGGDGNDDFIYTGGDFNNFTDGDTIIDFEPDADRIVLNIGMGTPPLTTTITNPANSPTMVTFMTSLTGLFQNVTADSHQIHVLTQLTAGLDDALLGNEADNVANFDTIAASLLAGAFTLGTANLFQFANLTDFKNALSNIGEFEGMRLPFTVRSTATNMTPATMGTESVMATAMATISPGDLLNANFTVVAFGFTSANNGLFALGVQFSASGEAAAAKQAQAVVAFNATTPGTTTAVAVASLATTVGVNNFEFNNFVALDPLTGASTVIIANLDGVSSNIGGDILLV